jgi:hypothetical protein
MATPSCISIKRTTAVLEWQWGGATRTLANGDPNHDAIQFTLQLDSSEHNSRFHAHFEISIPFRFKDKPAGAGVFLRINPFFIKSFNYVTLSKLSDALKQKFDSTTHLDLELDKEMTVLVPSDVEDPVRPFRGRSGGILDSIRELSCVTSLRIYIEESLLSVDELKLISEAVGNRQIQTSSDPNHDISRMFGGGGAKAVTIAPSEPPPYEPPSYENATQGAASSKRKRLRQDNPPDVLTDILNKLKKLESVVGKLQADNAQLRVQNDQLRDKVTRLEKSFEGLEAAQSLANGNDADEVTILELQEDVNYLDGRVTFLESGRDEEFKEELKTEVAEEIARRILLG